jgi:galactokinase/mevalonate kinase-like predicted kinase
MASGSAHARAALAGNPSDGFGGAVLACCIGELRAWAEAEHAAEATSDPPSALVDAAIARFGRGPCAVRWGTDVPREVGLGGSSAIVTAAVRALCALHGHALEAGELAEMVLAVEAEDLGIAAGPQDRYAQAHGGLLLMDFAAPAARVERLDPGLLPPLYLAWRTDAAETSHAVHGGLRERADEPAVRRAMARLADHARVARDALMAGDHAALAGAIDGSFDEREALLALDPRHVAMVRAAREAGASANYTGSGGAIVGTLPLEGPERIARALTSLDCAVMTLGNDEG